MLFGGLFLALGYLFTGLGLCLTIIGIPFGIQVFKLAGLALWPFGKEVRYKKQTTGCLNTGMNLLWILIGGIWLALGHAITGLVYCITIIGIPFGKQHFKLAAIILTPFGREVVSSNKVKKERAAIEEPTIPASEETPKVENALVGKDALSAKEAASPLQPTSATTAPASTPETVSVAASIVTTETASATTEDTPSADNAPIAEDTLSEVEAPTIEEDSSTDDEVNEEEQFSWLRQNRQWLIPAGVVALLAMLATGAYFLFFKAENNPLGIEKPKWEKFVAVTEEYAYIYKEADSSSPKLMSLTENSTEEGCYTLETKYRWADEGEMRGYTRSEFQQAENTIMPVISEDKDWYLVQIDTWEGAILKGYISKDDCKEVTPTPITQEVLDKLDKESNGQRCDYIVTKGKYKNLCLTSEYYEEEGDNGKNLSIGQLTDGVLLYPSHEWVSVVNNGSSTIAFTNETGGNGGYHFYQLSCGDEHLYNPEGRQDEWRSMFLTLDTHQLPDELIDDLVQTLKPDHPDIIKAVYYFPGISEYQELHSFSYSPQGIEYDQTTQSSNNEDIHIIGYDVVTKTTEYGDEEDFLMANLSNGCAEETGVSFPGGTPISGLTIEHFGDYDGDEDMEVIVQEHCGGSAGEEPPYIVYYDKDAKAYMQTNRFGKWDVVIVEEKDGKVTFVQRYGIHQDRYVYENHRLKQIEDRTMDVGRKLKTWSRNSVFPDDAIDDRIVTFDMDNDGVEEYLTLSHNNSRLYGDGEYIGLDGIRWQNGWQSEYPQVYVSESITILETMTNGMHDILAGEKYLFRWNGTFYEEWIWNGQDIVKKQE